MSMRHDALQHLGTHDPKSSPAAASLAGTMPGHMGPHAPRSYVHSGSNDPEGLNCPLHHPHLRSASRRPSSTEFVEDVQGPLPPSSGKGGRSSAGKELYDMMDLVGSLAITCLFLEFYGPTRTLTLLPPQLPKAGLRVALRPSIRSTTRCT